MTDHRPPRFARALLRLLPLGERRAEIEDDLMELFTSRVDADGRRQARRRYVVDVLSLWRHQSPRHAGPRERLRPRRSPTLGVAHVVQDLAYGVRLIRRTPGVVLIAIIGLGLAIGVGTSIFSILNIIAFRSTGIADPSAIVTVMKAYRTGIGNAWTYAESLQLQDATRRIRLETFLRDGASISRSAEGEGDEGAGVLLVSGGYLSMLNARAMLGRTLAAADATAGAPPVVVLNEAWWSRKLGADPSVVGRPLWLNGRAFLVVGIAEPGFTGTLDTPPAMWTTLANYHVLYGGLPLDRRSSVTVNITTRLSDVSRAQAEAELSSIALSADLGRAGPAGPHRPSASGDADPAGARPDVLTGVRLLPFGASGGNKVQRNTLIVLVVLTAVGLVLLLACANVTNLLLASAITRRAEIKVRVALGASRGRIVRQLLTESLSLGLAGGGLGLLFTIWLLPLLAGVVGVPDTFDVTPDRRAFLFLAAISVAAGLGAGLAPARDVIRDLPVPLTAAVSSSRGPSRSTRRRSALVGVQAAASMALLVLAALLARGAARAAHLDIGFEAVGLVTISPALGRTYDSAGAKAYWELALERVRSLPNVQSAALAEFPPFSGSSRVTSFTRDGGRYTIQQNGTDAGYFATLGLRLRAGRTYTREEVSARAPVAVISETVARDFFPGEDPIGQPLARVTDSSPATIIGVVSTAITARLRELGAAAIYEPITETSAARMVVRSRGPSDGLVQPLRSTLQAIDPRVRIGISKVTDGLRRQIAEPQALSTLAALLAVLAMALALVGLYGVTAFVTGQRRQEISVRIAIGASDKDVMRLLLRDGLRPVVWGLIAGVLASVLGSRVLAGALYGVSTADPLAFGGAAILLLAAATVAIFLPTRRATVTDPAGVLREM
jgi:predicted permease